MHYVYILYSKKIDRYYIGETQDLKARIAKHNSGGVKSTKGGIPWELKYYETLEDRSVARKRENAIKKKKSRKYIEYLVKLADTSRT